MSKEKLNEGFKVLSRRIELLINENKKMKEALIRTKREKEESVQKIALQSRQLEDFQNQIKVAKIARKIENVGCVDTGKEEVKKLLVEYIKDIDTCITCLENK